jgi:hypothetical protein
MRIKISDLKSAIREELLREDARRNPRTLRDLMHMQLGLIEFESSCDDLEHLDEATWHAWELKGGKRVGNPVDVEADTTMAAGHAASEKLFKSTGKRVDPFSIDLERAGEKDIVPPSDENTPNWRERLSETIRMLRDLQKDMKNKLVDVNVVKGLLADAQDDLDMISHAYDGSDQDVSYGLDEMMDALDAIHKRVDIAKGYVDRDVGDIDDVIHTLKAIGQKAKV